MILKCSTWYQKIIENADIWVNESDLYGCAMAVCMCVGFFNNYYF